MRVTSFGLCSSLFRAFPGGSDGKESACNAGEPRSAPGLGRSLGAGNGNPFQYSCLENSLVSSEITRTFQRILGAFMTPCPLDVSVLIQHHGSSMKGKENNSSHGNELKPPAQIHKSWHNAGKTSRPGITAPSFCLGLLEATCGLLWSRECPRLCNWIIDPVFGSSPACFVP